MAETDDSRKEFRKVINDLISDILTTFPELKDRINQDLVMNDDEALERVYEHCKKVFPERFFDILYQNEDIFKNETNTVFLPDLDFKVLMNDEGISDNTKDTIWKYLQLILLSVIKDVSAGESFGDTAKLFEAIDEGELKEKLKETVDKMHEMFDNVPVGEDGEKINLDNLPNPEDIHSHVSGMMDGKLGCLAREIAEETARDLNMDMEGAENVGDVFKNLFKNPGKLMDLVKNVGGKLDEKIKSGEINESELLEEAAEIVQKMKDIPGMGDIKDLLGKMGMSGGKNSKVNMGAFKAHMDKQMRIAKMKERMKNNNKKKFDGKTYSDGSGMDKTSLEEAQKKAEEAMRALLAEEEASENKKSKKKKKKKKKRKKNKKENDKMSDTSSTNDNK
tara:strand:- start:107 stop:1282 length:1176 start_codon:yes stop_codon:yes gene_type:complete